MSSPQSKKWFVYGLFCPKTKVLRYIGKTNNLRLRFYFHIRVARFKDPSHKSNWIRILLREKLKPVMTLLETYNTEPECLAREIQLIAENRAKGLKLCNMTDGGDGISGHKPTAIQLKKIGKALKRWYSDPVNRRRHHRIHRSRALRKKQSEIQKRVQSCFLEKEKRSKKMREVQGLPEVKAKRAKSLRAWWSNPRNYARMQRIQRQAWRARKQKEAAL